MRVEDVMAAMKKAKDLTSTTYTCLILYNDGSGHIKTGFATEADNRSHVLDWHDLSDMERKIEAFTYDKDKSSSIALQLRKLADELEGK